MIEGHFAAVRCADTEVFQIFDGLALVEWVAHHDFDIVTSALDTLGFDAVKRGAHLATEVGLAQTERLGRWMDVELDLSLATAVVVFDVKEAFVGGEFGFNSCRGGLESGKVPACELNIDRHTSTTCSVGVEGEFFDSSDWTDQLAPAVGKIWGGEGLYVAASGEVFALDQFDGDLGDVRAG